MIARIYTDASYFPDYKIGSFAFWIESRGVTVQETGVLKNCSSSTEAETMCICNALHTFVFGDFKKIKDIIITTDSEPSIVKINPRAKNGSPYKIAYGLLKTIRKKNNITNRIKNNFRHVKAHQTPDTVEKLINKWCDIEARKVGREYIKSINKLKIKNQ